MIEGRIHSLESFGSADGPGLRFVVFLNGCGLRCRYCHNPDTWARGDFRLMTPKDVLAKALRYRSYWAEDGGITVSGGEPLLQMDFLSELFRLAKEQNVSTCLDTAAQPFTRSKPWFTHFTELMQLTDLVLLDLKHIDSARHTDLTGSGNENILDCARCLSDLGTPVWIRHVLVPGFNSDTDTLERTAAFIRTLSNVRRIDVLPYHTLGVFKWKALGLPYTLEETPEPTEVQVSEARRILSSALQ